MLIRVCIIIFKKLLYLYYKIILYCSGNLIIDREISVIRISRSQCTFNKMLI
jgi:hypothetical protein